MTDSPTSGPHFKPVDPDTVLAWAREHLHLEPWQEEFLLAAFGQHRPDPRHYRPVPIPDADLQPYRDVIAGYQRTHSPRIVIDADAGRPEWMDPGVWDRLENARLAEQVIDDVTL